MDILILVAAVLLIGLFCYKNVPTLIGGIVCSVILMIIYKMNIVDGLFDTYMGGLVGFMKSWMILFFLGALFGKLLDVTGGSDSLARVILNLVGPKNVSLGVCLFTAILAMAGISSFISLFICYPIALKLCRKANINRASVIAGYSLGLNFGLAIPWVPVTNNVLCASYFGTDVSAGGLLGLFVSIVFIVVGMLYIKWYEKRLAAAGKGYAPLTAPARSRRTTTSTRMPRRARTGSFPSSPCSSRSSCSTSSRSALSSRCCAVSLPSSSCSSSTCPATGTPTARPSPIPSRCA